MFQNSQETANSVIENKIEIVTSSITVEKNEDENQKTKKMKDQQETIHFFSKNKKTPNKAKNKRFNWNIDEDYLPTKKLKKK